MELTQIDNQESVVIEEEDMEISLEDTISDYCKEEGEESTVAYSMSVWLKDLDAVGVDIGDRDFNKVNFQMTIEQAFRLVIERGWNWGRAETEAESFQYLAEHLDVLGFNEKITESHWAVKKLAKLFQEYKQNSQTFACSFVERSLAEARKEYERAVEGALMKVEERIRWDLDTIKKAAGWKQIKAIFYDDSHGSGVQIEARLNDESDYDDLTTLLTPELRDKVGALNQSMNVLAEHLEWNIVEIEV